VAAETAERFTHTPFVCGYLGADAGGHWSSLLEAAPVPVKERSRGRFHAFAASKAPGLERVPGHRAWTWGRYLVTRRAPRDWRDAAHDLALAGFWVSDGEVRLHTDALGHHSLYARVLDGTTYFSSRTDPLVRLGDSLLHTDWVAWAEHLALGGMAHDHTPFEEVRRLDFAESRVVRQGRQVRSRDTAPWMHVDDLDGTAADVLEAALDEMPAPGSQEASALGLSGGWDSRFIGILLAHRGVAPPSAWTAHKDMGMDDDRAFAPAVAAALGMEHHDAGPDRGYWPLHREPTLRRFEHEHALHTWLAPMSARVRRLGVPVWDGLHGDLLLRSVAVNTDLLWAGPRAAQREAQWIRLGGKRMDVATEAIRLDLRRRFHDEARASYLEGGRVFEGQASELVFRTATTKGARITGASPYRLLAPEAPVLAPFAAPAFFEAAVRVPPIAKFGTGWYVDLMSRLDPEVARLPSTNDQPEHVPLGRTPGQMRPRVLRAQAEAICADPVVLAMFHPRAQNLLREGRAMRDTGISMVAVQWGEALASWRARYRDRIADERL
jgi:hypothetical protein